MNQAGISLFIPAYNAELTLKKVVERISPSLWNRIQHAYLINDGSHDATGKIMEEIAADHPKCRVLHQPVNSGYGATVRTGLACCKKDGCVFAVCLHADGQYPPEVIEACVAKMEYGGIDLLQGSRIASGTALSGGMPLYKYIGGTVLTMMENRIFRLTMTDYHSGFLIYGRRFLDTVNFDRLSSSFDIDLELIAIAKVKGLVIGEYPIPTRYAEEISYLKPVPYAMRVLRVMCRFVTGYYHRMQVSSTIVR